MLTFVRIVSSKKFGPVSQINCQQLCKWDKTLCSKRATQLGPLLAANLNLRAALDSVIHNTSDPFNGSTRNPKSMGSLLVRAISELQLRNGMFETPNELGEDFAVDKDSARQTHVCSDDLNLLQIAPAMAKLKSASSNTMNGVFPPSSRPSFFNDLLDCCIRSLPTRVEPVKDILRTV